MTITLTRAAALLGAADTGYFLARRPCMIRDSPGRAGGTALTMATWIGLAASASGGAGARRRSIALASVLTAANGAMLAAHIKHRIVSPRVVVGPALSGLALVSSLVQR